MPIDRHVTPDDTAEEIRKLVRKWGRPKPSFIPDTNESTPGGSGSGGSGGSGSGHYRQYVVVSDGSGGFEFVDDGAGNPVESLEALE